MLPINMATGPVGTFAQLYILELHGSVLDIGLAATLFAAASIPAAIFWGIVTDRIHTRKALVVWSYILIAGIVFSFAFVRTVYGIILVYSAFSFLSSAFATPLNLLIMETQPKASWASEFARFSMISSVGVTCRATAKRWMGWLSPAQPTRHCTRGAIVGFRRTFSTDDQRTCDRLRAFHDCDG